MADIFLGLTPAAARKYVKTHLGRLRHRHDRVVLPACGRFATAEAVCESGWEPSKVQTSDISLFSSVVDFVASWGSLDGLGGRFVSERFERLNACVGTRREVGAVLYAMKVAQLNPATVFERVVYDDMVRDPDRYIDDLAEKVDRLAEKLRGIGYDVRDMVAHIDEAAEDPRAVIFLNPPLFAGGYEKMFCMAGTEIVWDTPTIPLFDVKRGLTDLYRKLIDAKALTVFYKPADTATNSVPEWLSSHAVYADRSAGKNEFPLSDWPDELVLRVDVGKSLALRRSPYPLLPRDHEITASSKAWIVATDMGTALYYRDLFAHELGVTRSEGYFLVIVDGYLLGVFGMMFERVNTGKDGLWPGLLR